MYDNENNKKLIYEPNYNIFLRIYDEKKQPFNIEYIHILPDNNSRIILFRKYNKGYTDLFTFNFKLKNYYVLNNNPVLKIKYKDFNNESLYIKSEINSCCDFNMCGFFNEYSCNNMLYFNIYNLLLILYLISLKVTFFSNLTFLLIGS